MADPYLIEDAIRDFIRTLESVTDKVGQRIRPGTLDEADTLPAVVILVDREEQQNDLEIAGGLVLASVHIHAIARSHRQARILSKLIATNNTDPGSGLNGHEDETIQSVELQDEVYTPVPEGDDGDGWRHVITAAYDVYYTAPESEHGTEEENGEED